MPRSPVPSMGNVRVVRPFALILALVFVPPAARADDHVGDADLSFSHLTGSSLWGGQSSLAWTLAGRDARAKPKPWAALVDLSVNDGTSGGIHLTRFTYTLGTRISWPLGCNRKVVVFGEVLGGGLHDSDGPNGSASPAVWGGGGGLDYFPKRKHSCDGQRATKDAKGLGPGETFGLRVRFDWFDPTSDSVKNYSRQSLGFVYRFGR